MIDVQLNKIKAFYETLANIHHNVKTRLDSGSYSLNQAISQVADNKGTNSETVWIAYELIELSKKDTNND